MDGQGNMSLTCLIGPSTGQQLQKGQSQKMEEALNHAHWHKRFLAKNRRLIAMLLPCSIAQFLYWSTFISYGQWQLYPQKYEMSITMVIASIISGKFTEKFRGGGKSLNQSLNKMYTMCGCVSFD